MEQEMNKKMEAIDIALKTGMENHEVLLDYVKRLNSDIDELKNEIKIQNSRIDDLVRSLMMLREEMYECGKIEFHI